VPAGEAAAAPAGRDYVRPVLSQRDHFEDVFCEDDCVRGRSGWRHACMALSRSPPSPCSRPRPCVHPPPPPRLSVPLPPLRPPPPAPFLPPSLPSTRCRAGAPSRWAL
jgi:hypothetical protein